MRKNTKNKLVFLASLLMAAGVYGWFYPLNKGTLELKTGLTGYQALVDGQPLPCTADPCSTRLQSGSHALLILKEKHTTFAQPVLIRRGQVTQVEVNLERVYTLEPSQVVPKLSAATTKSTALFWDPADERVKLKKPDGSPQIITSLSGLASPPHFYGSPAQTEWLGVEGRDLYFINTAEGGRRKRTLEFEPQNLRFSPRGDYAVLNDAKNQLFKVSFAEAATEPLKLELDLAQSAWLDDDTLLYASTDPKTRRTDIKTYQPVTERQTTLTVQFEFVATRFTFDTVNKTAYVQKADRKWYELKL